MNDFAPSDPEHEEIILEFPKLGIVLDKFIEYSFSNNFLDAGEAFSFTFAADRFSEEARNALRTALRPGTLVQLKIDGAVQATGYIDTLEVSASQESGAEWRLEGFDKLKQAVDACADPTVKFKPGTTLVGALKTIFAPYGWSTDDAFDVDGLADRDVRQNVQGKRVYTTKKKRKKLSSYELHQLQPKTGEGLFDFASRIANRQGLLIWPSADGKKLIVSRPDFESKPIQKLYRSSRGGTNMLGGSVRLDTADQPTIIIADGFSGGGDFTPRNKILAAMTNTAVFTDDTTFVNLQKRFPGVRILDTHSYELPLYVPFHRLAFLHDNDAQTMQQLEFFIRRAMAKLQIRHFTARYTVEGHGQNTPDGYAIWSINSCVDVFDEVGYVDEPLFVLGRTFKKSRSGGTTTDLHLVRRFTIDLGGDDAQPSAEDGEF